MTTKSIATVSPLIARLRFTCKSAVICGLMSTSTFAAAADADQNQHRTGTSAQPLAEFYQPTPAHRAKPATSIAADRETKSEDAGTRKGKAKLVADAKSAKTMHGGSGGTGKKKKVAEDPPPEAEHAADTEHAAEEPATTEAAPTDAPATAEAAAAEKAAHDAEAPPAEATAEQTAPAESAPTGEHAAAEPAPEHTATAEPAPQEDADHASQSAAAEQGAAGDCNAKPAAVAAAPKEPDPHWSYEGDTGPEHWAQLSPKFEACGAGTRQTPINIESSGVELVGLEDVQFNYGPTQGKIVNNGHTIQVNVDEGNSIVLDGVQYNLAQFHFHTPSEHTLDGGSYPMELHLVHKDDKGHLAVVGVMLEKGAKSPVLNQVLGKLPKAEGKPVALKDPIDLKALLPTDLTAFRYTGSLTTPPCTEGVKWIVLRSTMAVTMKQIAAFKKLFPMNARPLQPLNARSVLEDSTSQSAQAAN